VNWSWTSQETQPAVQTALHEIPPDCSVKVTGTVMVVEIMVVVVRFFWDSSEGKKGCDRQLELSRTRQKRNQIENWRFFLFCIVISFEGIITTA